MKKIAVPICNSTRGACVAAASEIISRKWTPMILFALGNDRVRFGELRITVGSVNPRTLSARLSALEADGVIKKTVFVESPPRVEYYLSAKGRDLLPIIESMIRWGEKHGRCSS